MGKHTPGPWSTQIQLEHNQIAILHSRFFVAAVPSYEDSPLDHANARLIAAAPDLLASLKAITAWAEGLGVELGGLGGPMNSTARAAIAKAEAA